MHPVRFAPARHLALAMICLVPLALGCGGKDADDGADDSAAVDTVAQAAATPDASTPSEAASAPAPLDVADIDRWQKGMAGELEAVNDAGEALKNAKTGTDSVNAIFAANETSTRAAGARAAGVDEERYQRIRTTLSPLAAQLAPLALTMDVSQMPKAAVEELEKSRAEALARIAAELPPALVEAMRPRAAELRKQELELVAQRLKAAGMAR